MSREQAEIRNPILRGFHPDPSIVRVGEDYYMATSTFQWFPGVQIHHSRDLVHWRPLGRPLDRPGQLDMTGNPDSGGVWAPCLSYDDGAGLFYLVYTDVKSHAGAFKDTHNYVVTAPAIEGPWSDPVYLNSSGFDPSMFHDDDGRKWIVNMQWDFRKGKDAFNGIYLREYSVNEGQLVGPSRKIYAGSELGLTEGPHLYKQDGRYYLMVAEGGTSYEHAVTTARSRTLEGPYETDPRGPMLTSRHAPELPLQKAGHASLVRTQSGEWYIAHLCGRPLEGADRRCNLGRETALQRCEWTADGWLRLASGGNTPETIVRGPALPAHPFPSVPDKDDFDREALGLQWQTLRQPFAEAWATLTERPGFLRLRGMESPNSRFRHSLVGRRQQAFVCEAATVVEFEPETYQQMAGLMYYYNSQNYYYLRIGRDEALGKNIGIIAGDHGVYDEHTEPHIPIPEGTPVHLKLELNGRELRFRYSLDGQDWQGIGPTLDASKISDEYATHLVDGYFTDWGFTGAFVCLCAHDLSGAGRHADFDWFVYREKEE
ncbi:glycoside hydrolase 43 family protein [Cohnella sp. CIP 111063]|uniref:glycoside hydrolase family 43 protein n=1 Tax=unclassified Cohnella TaxID=2636738 RepID=UPI000B8C651A|nr:MULTISPECIES: glycoside hydrolase family 43 protein [unclassified Cohnella]OXS54499.1 glycoside hydrolase 43 family protein [Cohnella sp. CIP 111063]PRX64002.1 xylan 1,4-beta-xylosidase [Cohnella sp. SGD-V74]